MARILFSFWAMLSYGFVLAADQHDADLYPAVSKDKTGYISREGEVLIPFVFEDGKEFSRGLAAVLIDGKWGYINKKAEIVIKPLFQDAGNFSEDMACVQVKGKYGYINREAAVAIEPKYRRATSFSEGFAVAEIDWRRDVLLDKAGKVKIGPDLYRMMYEPTATLSAFSEGLLLAYPKGGRSPVYLDRDGQIVVRAPVDDRPGCYTKGTAFSEGLAAMEIKGKLGYIDKTGKMVIAPEYEKATPFRQGLACVTVEEKKDGAVYWKNYIIDRKGTKLKQIPVTYGGFSEGLVPFGKWDKVKREPNYGYMDGPKYGYLDTQGEIVIQPQLDRALPFQKGLARVRIRGADAYIDKQGRPVWIGETRGDERVTSYSGKSMIDMYSEILRENETLREGRRLLYILKMSREELVEGSRITLKWLLKDPKRTASRDVGRSGVIGMVAVAPFFQIYSRSFVKEDKPVDPSPFQSMLIDKSLDIDFRRGLATCFGDDDFYVSNWEQIAEDTEVLNKLVRDPTEDEKLRAETAESSCDLILRLYREHRRETIKDNASAEKEREKNPDIVAMLGETPSPFSPANKARWELLVKCMENVASGALKLYGEAKTEKTRWVVYRLLKRISDYHLLQDNELLKRVEKIKTKEEKAKAKSNQGNP